MWLRREEEGSPTFMSMLETKNGTAQVQTDGDSSIDLYPEPAENCLVKWSSLFVISWAREGYFSNFHSDVNEWRYNACRRNPPINASAYQSANDPSCGRYLCVCAPVIA